MTAQFEGEAPVFGMTWQRCVQRVMVLYYSEGEGKEIRLRKFLSAAAHGTV